MKITKTSFLAIKRKINEGADDLFLKNTTGISDTSLWKIKKSKSYPEYKNEYKKLINKGSKQTVLNTGKVSPIELLQKQHESTIKKIDEVIKVLEQIKAEIKY